MNLSRMSELLIERQDLVKIYFTSAIFTYDLFLEMIEKFNCEGECQHRNFQFNDEVNCISHPSSEYLAHLSTEQLCFLTDFFNSNEFFSVQLTIEDTRNLFECCLEQPLQSLNNARLAMFLFCLRDKQILVHKWQKVIQDHKLILSSSTGLPLKQSNISNALTEYRRSHGGPDSYFVRVANHLKEMTE